MDHLDRLRAATHQAQRENDLPDALAARIFALADQLAGRSGFGSEIDALAEQVALYDTYGQTGYIGMGVDNFILEGAIVRLEQQLEGIDNH